MKSKGLVERLEFRESTHRYFLDGRELMGVTSTFTRTGIVNFSKVKAEVIEPALMVGDFVHEMAELYGQGKLDETSIDDGSESGFDLRGYHKAIKKFYEDNVKEVLLIEQAVCDPYHGYAGTPDIIYVNFEDRVCLDDWKTPKKPHPAWGPQTAAYENAVEKCFTGLKIHRRGGILLRENGTYERHAHRHAIDFENFLAFLRTARSKEQHKINS